MIFFFSLFFGGCYQITTQGRNLPPLGNTTVSNFFLYFFSRNHGKVEGSVSLLICVQHPTYSERIIIFFLNYISIGEYASGFFNTFFFFFFVYLSFYLVGLKNVDYLFVRTRSEKYRKNKKSNKKLVFYFFNVRFSISCCVCVCLGLFVFLYREICVVVVFLFFMSRKSKKRKNQKKNSWVLPGRAVTNVTRAPWCVQIGRALLLADNNKTIGISFSFFCFSSSLWRG